MSDTSRAWGAVAALAAIVAITASWWALALWPVGSEAPDWFLRTRDVCFGSRADSLPTAAGWLVLVGQPIGMLGLLATVWGTELRAGMSLAMARATGQLTVGLTLALVVAGLGATAVRVRTASVDRFAAGTTEMAAQLTRVNDVAPPLRLTDQSGQQITLESFHGRPVIVTFAFAHCETVCPAIVSNVLEARRSIEGDAPPVLIVTLDPWRDTPSRLPSIAGVWRLAPGAHVLSGPPDEVERALNAWRIPRTRNQKTGDILHPSIVYIVNADGRIAYVVNGSAEAISAAVRAL